MLSEIDIKKLPSYNWGLQQGLERGLEQGLERGLEQGFERGLEQGLERGLEQGLERGLQQGLEQGRKQEAVEIAKQMLNFMDDEKIAKITKLPYEAIKSLRKSKPH